MKIKKIFGWVLLVIGLIIIFGSLYFSFNVFMGRSEAPEIFKLEKANEKTEEVDLSGFSPEEIQDQMQKVIEEQISNIMPAEFTSKLFNLISWSIFAGILIFAGSRVSSIGIRLMRKGS